MRDYRCGSIWIVSFDPSVGTEIRKTRPALIVSSTDFNQVRSKVTLLPISSTFVKAKKILPVIVRVKQSQDNGLQSDSTIIAIEPSTFDKHRLVEYVGQLEENYFSEIKSILKSYFNL